MLTPPQRCCPSHPCPSFRITNLNQKTVSGYTGQETLEESLSLLKPVWWQLHKNKGGLERLSGSEIAKHKCFSNDILFNADSV